MRHRIAALPLAAALTALLVFASGTDAAALLLINNGLAPPNPENVIDTTIDEEILVANVGCGEPFSCAMPGPPTTVEVVDGGSLRPPLSVDYSSTVIVSGGFVSQITALDSSRFIMNGGTVLYVLASGIDQYTNPQVAMNGGLGEIPYR